MKQEKLSIIIFILSLIALLISIRLFWNLGIFVDEYNVSSDIVSGGDFWLYMDWLRLLLLFIICIVSGINILKNNIE